MGTIGKSACIALALGVGLLCAPLAQAAGPPEIAAAWVTDVTSTSATLHAQVNPEGLETEYRFEYITEAKFKAEGESFAKASRAPSFGEEGLGSEETDQPASQHLVSLAPGTSYVYRIVATNSQSPAGDTLGSVHAFTTQSNASFASEECPNAQLRFEDGSFSLPDCRAWELVSPVDKNGAAVAGVGAISGGDTLQAAASGEAATYSSSASFAGGLGAPVASQYISRRVGGEAGWSTENITGPTASGAYGNGPDGVPYQLFSEDLGRGLLLNGVRCAEGEECPRSYSLRESEGGALTTTPAESGLRFAGASPDLRHLVFTAAADLYAWPGAGGLTPIGKGPGSALAASSGAISADGSSVYFTDAGDLYLREGALTKQVDNEVGGGGEFQAASADGAFAFFSKGGHLYRYEANFEDLSTIDLTPAGGVVGVLGASANGSAVYYATASGIFLWDAGTTTEVAPGAGAAQPSDYPPATGTARVSPDGSHLAFLSKASLTGYDNTDQGTGEPDSEVFLYTAPQGGGEGTLLCVSCNPTGERPVGPSTIPGAIANGETPGSTQAYKPRDLSTAGARLFFDSSDRVVNGDGSAAQDIYEWEAPGAGGCAAGSPGFHSISGGCLFLISSGSSPEASSFVDASADGRDAFFLTGDSLIGRDPGSVDLYDAREGGGVPEPAAVIPCDGDACQAVPSPPEDPAPGTIVPGQPNPPVHFPKTHHKKPKKTHKHHHRKGHK